VPKISIFRPSSERRFDPDLHEVGGSRGRLAGAPGQIGARDVESYSAAHERRRHRAA
jgi:hypothetical protein